MSTTIDHLRADHRVQILRDFRDARGLQCHAGETAVIRQLRVDWIKFDLFIDWERNGRQETLFFQHGAADGPRSGRMRDYFEIGERVPLPEDTLVGRAARQAAELRSSVPALVEEPITDPVCYGDAVARIWALAVQHRFADAAQQIRLILQAPDEHAERLQNLAEDLVNLAAAYSTTDDGELYDWLRERGISLWYAWGSQATSGGEGSVRRLRIRAAELRIPSRSGES
jgi:hypothetical protein